MIGIGLGIPGTARRLSAPAFSPASLLPFAWYRDEIVSSGGLITQWTDKSGGGRHLTATAANRPTLATAVAEFGGKDAVDFSIVVTAGLEATTTVAADWTFLHDATGGTIWLLARRTVTALGWLINTQGSSQAGRGVSVIGDYPSAGKYRYAVGDGTTASTLDCTCLDGTGRLYEAQYATQAGDDQRVFEGATEIGTTAGLASPSGSAPASRLIVGNYTGLVNSFQGQVAELLIFNRLLTTGERASLAAYKTARYG